MICARVMNSSRASSLAIRSSSRWRKRVSTSREAVVLVGRRAQRLREHGEVVDAQRQLAARGCERGAVDADEVAEVEVEQALHALLAEHVEPACSCSRPERSTRSRNAILPWPRRAASAAGDAVARLGLLPGARGPRGAGDAARPARRPGTRAGTGRCRPRAAGRACARATAKRSPARSGSLVPRRRRQADVDLRDLQLARWAAWAWTTSTSSPRLWPSERPADRRLVGELALGRAWPRRSRRSCT